MQELVLASGNGHKISEITAKLQSLGLDGLYWRSLADYPDLPMPPEDGDSFTANALIKARSVAAFTGLPALADDSGLEVAALNGAPGIYSARYAGPAHDDAANNAKLLAQLAGLPPEQRRARFRCVVALVEPGGKEFTADGAVEGYILEASRGAAGFGYDPLFLLPQLGQTMAELDAAQKNSLSHRGRALEAILPQLQGLFKA